MHGSVLKAIRNITKTNFMVGDWNNIAETTDNFQYKSIKIMQNDIHAKYSGDHWFWLILNDCIIPHVGWFADVKDAC